jgi:hypothetical protein
MAALAENNTNRLFVDYVTNTTDGVEHTFYLRYSGADRTAAAAQAVAVSLLSGYGAGNLRATWKVIRLRTQMAHEQFSFPQTLIPALSSFAGSTPGAYTRDRNSEYATFVGRSPTSGRRSLISLFGFFHTVPATGRVSGSAGGTNYVSAACNALNAATATLVSVDGSPVIWYYYVNYGRNSYWQKRLRIG